jgi:hypothetical protein
MVSFIVVIMNGPFEWEQISAEGSFNIAKKELVNKGIKAMYEVLRKGRIHNLSIKCQLDLFDKIVKPILLYGCEIWGCKVHIYDIPLSFKILWM